MVKGQIRLHSKNVRNFQDIFFSEKMRIFFKYNLFILGLRSESTPRSCIYNYCLKRINSKLPAN